MDNFRPTPPATIWAANVVVPDNPSSTPWTKSDGPLSEINVNTAADTDQKTLEPNETPSEYFRELGAAQRLDIPSVQFGLVNNFADETVNVVDLFESVSGDSFKLIKFDLGTRLPTSDKLIGPEV